MALRISVFDMFFSLWKGFLGKFRNWLSGSCWLKQKSHRKGGFNFRI
jgi:hypothetical protein